MAKVSKLDTSRYDPEHVEYAFWCPGCCQMHSFITQWGERNLEFREKRFQNPGRSLPPPAQWTFNHDLNRPTFSPSLLYSDKIPRCHLFLTDGQIRYLSDCGHKLAGLTVECPDVDLEDLP